MKDYAIVNGCCDLRSVAAVADEDAAALGLSLDAACHPDAFGQARVAGKISPGPLNAVPDGLMLLVR